MNKDCMLPMVTLHGVEWTPEEAGRAINSLGTRALVVEYRWELKQIEITTTLAGRVAGHIMDWCRHSSLPCPTITKDPSEFTDADLQRIDDALPR